MSSDKNLKTDDLLLDLSSIDINPSTSSNIPSPKIDTSKVDSPKVDTFNQFISKQLYGKNYIEKNEALIENILLHLSSVDDLLKISGKIPYVDNIDKNNKPDLSESELQLLNDSIKVINLLFKASFDKENNYARILDRESFAHLDKKSYAMTMMGGGEYLDLLCTIVNIEASDILSRMPSKSPKQATSGRVQNLQSSKIITSQG